MTVAQLVRRALRGGVRRGGAGWVWGVSLAPKAVWKKLLGLRESKTYVGKSLFVHSVMHAR